MVLPTAISFSNEYTILKPTINLSPDLVYFPTSHNFGDVIEGQTYQTTFQMWNGGTDILTWNLGIVHTWISPSPTSGSSTGYMDRDTVTVTIDTTGMSIGPHSGFVSISANDGGGVRNFNIDLNIVTNNPPNTPAKMNGPSSGAVNTWLTFTTSTTDPDGDPVLYGFDYSNDDIVDYWSTSYISSGATYTINFKTDTPGIYYLRMKAEDIYGAQSGFSPAKMVTITEANDPPNTPSTPFGPNTGVIEESLSFSTSTTDPDNDKVKYGWDWDADGTVDEWSGLLNSGNVDTRSHAWSSSGIYQIKVKAQDEHGEESGWSASLLVTISGENNAPLKPTQPEGESSGKAGTSYTYSSSTTDPDTDRIFYLFDWGDGTESGWIGPYDSGDTIFQSHIWTAQGDYVVKVKAKDDPNDDGDPSDGMESVWSDPLQISMPKNKATVVSFQMFLKKIFERNVFN